MSGVWEGACPSPDYRIKVNYFGNAFKNVDVDHWVHALYMKILNMFSL